MTVSSAILLPPVETFVRGIKFLVDQDGISVILKTGKGKEYPVQICTTLMCIAWTRNSEYREWGRVIRITDADGIEHTMTIPVTGLSDERSELFSVLMNEGFRIVGHAESRRNIIHYLSHADPGKRVRCVSQVGWHHDVYVMGDANGTVISATPQTEESYLQATIAVRACRALGTLEEWRMHVAVLAVGNSRLAFVLSCGFAGMLLYPLGIHSGCFNLRGSSSTGKTKALVAATTVSGTYVESWRATDNAMEAVAAAHNDRLMAVDELGQLEDRVLGNVIYMLGNERGKTRMTGGLHVRPPYAWRLLLVSSSEISMADKIESAGKRSMAGQEVRMVDVPAVVEPAAFGVWENLHGFPSGSAFSDHVEEVSRKYTGMAGEAFLRRLVTDREAVRQQWPSYKARFLADHVPVGADGQVLRVAERFALVGFAGWLATGYGITGWPEPESEGAAAACMKSWLAERGSVGGLELEKAVTQIRGFIEAHGPNRFQYYEKRFRDHMDPANPEAKTHPTQDQQVQNRVGFREWNPNEGTHFYVLPEMWRKELCKGFDARRVAEHMIAKGYLQRSTDGKTAGKRSLPGFPNKRFYHILPTLMSDDP